MKTKLFFSDLRLKYCLKPIMCVCVHTLLCLFMFSKCESLSYLPPKSPHLPVVAILEQQFC